MTGRDNAAGPFSSPPAWPAKSGRTGSTRRRVDPQQGGDVARWRRGERSRLRRVRDAMRADARRAASEAIAAHLGGLIAARISAMRGHVLSGYWPIKGEPDLRPLLAALCAQGAVVALPVVETKGAPLAFRRRTPETRMVRGDLGIPVPPPEAERPVPQAALAPLVGWDGAGFRLGDGGGCFDRTLAALSPLPLVVGVGYEAARLATIHPQPHDIPLDAIVTEAGVRFDRERL